MKRIFLIFSLCMLYFMAISSDSTSKANERRAVQIQNYQAQIKRLQTGAKGNEQTIAKLNKRIEVLKNRMKHSNSSE